MAELNLSKAKSDGGHEIRWSRAGIYRGGGVKRAGLMKLKCVFERARGPHLPTHCRGPRQCHLC